MAMNATRALLRQGKSALLICDIQTAFAKAMKDFDKFVQNSSKLVNIYFIYQTRYLYNLFIY